MRSRSRLRTTPTRYFVDPSIGAAALEISSQDLLGDLPAAGYHFEALVVRDLRIYAQAIGGRVDTWRDGEGNEVDAIITLPGGRWAAVEIKMSQRGVDSAAAGLLKFADRVDTVKQGRVSNSLCTGSLLKGQNSDCDEDTLQLEPGQRHR
jgi:predicted AAA+ superfamily ATPase